MLTKNGNIKCDVCGRFIRLDDFMVNLATKYYIAPDSVFSDECIEHIHARCNEIRQDTERSIERMEAFKLLVRELTMNRPPAMRSE